MSIELAEQPAAPSSGSPHASRRGMVRAAAGPLLAVVALTLAGLALRLVVAGQSIFADELSTYWISATHSLSGVVSLMYGTPHIPHPEITPPLYFLAAWVTTHLGHSVQWLRAPSLLAGALTIPLTYGLGSRLVGRRPALIATAFTALSPFMIYYSAEARSYALMMAFVLASTLSMLLALDSGRARWWVLYAACSWGAFLSHYTSAFVLAAQFGWVLWAHPEARRRVLIANLAAAAAVLPWLPGLVADFNSPTLNILSALSPFTPIEVWRILEHWTVGYPYEFAGGLSRLPGVLALILLAVAFLGSLAALLHRASALRHSAGPTSVRAWVAELDRRAILTVLLAVSVPIGEAIVSAAGNHIFGVRNLAASWPFLALSFALLLSVSGRVVGLVASGLAIVAFGIGAIKMLGSDFQRPDIQAAADFVAQHARPGDVVVDETGTVSPGPLTALDASLHRRLALVRAGAPAERGHPFEFSDRTVPLQDGIRIAVAQANGHRVFLVGNTFFSNVGFLAKRVRVGTETIPASYREIERRSWPGIRQTFVKVLAPTGSSSP